MWITFYAAGSHSIEGIFATEALNGNFHLSKLKTQVRKQLGSHLDKLD